MGKPIVLLMMVALAAFTGCSGDDGGNADTIVGTWALEASTSDLDGNVLASSRDAWVFSSDNTGTFTDTDNRTVSFETAFTWSKEEDVYSVIYANTERSPDIFTIGDLAGNKVLMSGDFAIAVKE